MIIVNTHEFKVDKLNILINILKMDSKESHTYKLTYFDIKGAAEKIRLAFRYYKIKFEDERIAFKDWPAFKPKTKFSHIP